MQKFSLHNEVKSVLSHYSTIFSYYIKFYFIISILLVVLNFYFGAYLMAITNLLFILPSFIMVLINYKKIKNSSVPFYLIITVIVTSYSTLVIHSFIYYVKFPYLAFWFIICIYSINTINLQKYAIFVHLLTFCVVFRIFFVKSIDFSFLVEDNINSFYFQLTHIVLIIITIIFLEYINNKLFQKLLIDMYHKNVLLEKMHKDQIDIQKVKNDFFATISHEMRTPLNAINAISEIESTTVLRKNELDENKIILNYSSRHLLNLINDVLDFSKINLGELDLYESRYNLKEAIEINFKLNVKGNINDEVEFLLSFNCDLPKYVILDLQRFNQILINLMSNGLKFTPKGFVNVIIDGDYQFNNRQIFDLKISVIDTGIGIEAAIIEKIYDKHFQNIPNQLGGVGLGLFIVKQIVQKMKGSIEVKSNVSQGTNFTVNLPLKVCSDKVNPIIQINKTAKLVENVKILIVDDNKINQKIMKKILEVNFNNAVLFYCNDGVEVLEFIENNEVDIILMDLVMPNLDGFECSKRIRNHNNIEKTSIPIIIVTANVWGNDFDSFATIGINDIITKPIDINLLLTKINTCLIN